MKANESESIDKQVIYYYFNDKLSSLKYLEYGKITFNFQNGKITFIERTETIKK